MDAEPSRLIRMLARILARLGVLGAVSRLLIGPKLTAVAWLTMKAAVRHRLFLAVAFALAVVVTGLPMALKGDGTAQGLTRILLTYTLGSITVLMAVSTMWLSCGALAKDIDECQIQTIAVKPIARWQIWLGKFLGILMMNAILLVFAGGMLVTMIEKRAAELSPEQQEMLRNEVLVGRGVAAMPKVDYGPDIELTYQRILETEEGAKDVPEEDVKKMIAEQLRADDELLPSGHSRVFNVNLAGVRDSIEGLPVFLKFQFFAAKKDKNNVYYFDIIAGPAGSTKARARDMELPGNNVNTIPLPPDLLDEEGVLRIEIANHNETDVLVPLEGGMEILYREYGFAGNFFRGMAIIFLWLTLLAAIGLAASSLLSFPVASFFSMGVLIVGLSGGTMSSALEYGGTGEADHESGAVQQGKLDPVLMPLFKVLLKAINLVEDFSPIENLSEGRSITWGELGKAVFQIGILMNGFFGVIGVAILSRRELATAQRG